MIRNSDEFPALEAKNLPFKISEKNDSILVFKYPRGSLRGLQPLKKVQS